MILLVHMLFGAAIGATVKSIPLAIILAFLGHYFLDLFPHVEYSVSNLRQKQWQKALPDVLKVAADFFLGVVAIFLFSNKPMAYAGAFVALIPDGLTLVSSLFPNKALAWHDYLHIQKIHYFKYKKVSNVWRIMTQVTVILVSIILLRL